MMKHLLFFVAALSVSTVCATNSGQTLKSFIGVVQNEVRTVPGSERAMHILEDLKELIDTGSNPRITNQRINRVTTTLRDLFRQIETGRQIRNGVDVCLQKADVWVKMNIAGHMAGNLGALHSKFGEAHEGEGEADDYEDDFIDDMENESDSEYDAPAGGMGQDLLSQIKIGKKLKPVNRPADKPPVVEDIPFDPFAHMPGPLFPQPSEDNPNAEGVADEEWDDYGQHEDDE